jgi:hypothetical protein
MLAPDCRSGFGDAGKANIGETLWIRFEIAVGFRFWAARSQPPQR